MQTAARERILPMKGGHNFRDIGGYPARDGRYTAWGLVYRSGTMAELDEGDQGMIERLGLRVICDFRSSRERDRRPSRLPRAADFEIWSHDYETSSADLVNKLAEPGATAAGARTLMIQLYRDIAYEQRTGYRALFERLVSGALPILFHCTAGKDRTGVAAALLLDMLGVSREAIIEDYVLTDHFFDRGCELVRADPWVKRLGAVDPAIWAPVMRADPAYLASMFETVEKRHGSAEGFIRDELGLDDMAIGVIRNRLLI
ncbi:MAG TPA: tyrosine-protein phosphatase [Sphingomonas sp.]|nr:tyrosine-protein phosphatase [Sphingomonas sp.]